MNERLAVVRCKRFVYLFKYTNREVQLASKALSHEEVAGHVDVSIVKEATKTAVDGIRDLRGRIWGVTAVAVADAGAEIDHFRL